MSARDVDVDALFDRNADTQLLDRRRREELGLAPLVAPSSSSTPVRFGPESMLFDEMPQRARGAMLRVTIDARPERELIPGAVVTVVASVHVDGDAQADDVLLRIALPADCEALHDSFARGDVALDGESLLGEGLRVGAIAASDAVRVRFAMRVLPGTGTLDVLAHASAPGVPAIAAPALRLTRRAGHAAFDAPRPFFELETGERDDTLTAAVPAPPPAPAPPRTVDTVSDAPAAPVVESPEIVVPDVVAEPAVVIAVPDVVVEPEVVVTPEFVVKAYDPAIVIVKRAAPEPVVEEPVAVEPVVAEPVVVEAVVAEPVELEPMPVPKPRARKRAAPRAKPSSDLAHPYVLARTLYDDDVRALERIFSDAVPHGLAALALLSAIAASETPLGAAFGIRDFARAISAAVPRALVAARMDRPVPAIVTREALDAIRPAADAPHEPFPQYFPLLATRLDERELGALRTVLERDLDDVFLRGVQVLLAVVPRALDGVPSETGTRAAEALTAYRVAAGAWLMRVTVRRAVDRRYDPLTAADAALHESGRKLVAALRGAIA